MDSAQSAFGPNARRKVLTAAVCAILHEAGFQTTERSALETLVEMLQALLCEMGRAGRAAAELAGRTEVVVPDLVLALVEMGINVPSIPAYVMNNPNKLTIPAPHQAARQSTPKILQAGEKKSHFSYIPDHMPAFPDPHSYIRTPTYKQPVTEYEAIREKSASQKRDVERALTRFMAKTSESSTTHCLIPDDLPVHLFPLIPLRPAPNPYLTALLPKDQVFEDDEEEEVKAAESAEKLDDGQTPGANEGDSESGNAADGQTNLTKASAEEVPDNPYLRSPKIVKKRRL
jgi:transcription initiation factor TFIID subunit 8